MSEITTNTFVPRATFRIIGEDGEDIIYAAGEKCNCGQIPGFVIKTKESAKPVKRLKDENKYSFRGETLDETEDAANSVYVHSIVSELNKLTKFPGIKSFGKHYLLTNGSIQENTLFIRRPGKTVGKITLDKNDVIIECMICDPAYKDNANEVLKQFDGKKMIIPK